MPTANGTPAGEAVDPTIEQVLSDFESGADDGGEPTNPDAVSQDGAEVESPPETPEGQGPADSGETDPNATSASGTPEPTPEEIQAEPFTYTVNGETRTDHGAYRIPGDGVYIPEKEVPRYQQAMSRAETNERQVRDLYHENRRLTELMGWQVTGADGKPQTMAGVDGLGEMRAILAQQIATARTLNDYVSKPELLATLIGGADQGGNLILNPDGIRQLKLAVENAQLRVSHATRADWAQRTSGIARAPQPSTPSQPSFSPDAVGQQATQAVTAMATQAGLTLSSQASAFLAQQFPRYVRAAAEGERDAQGVFLTPGEPVVDPAFAVLMKREAGRPAAASKTTQATQFNAGQQRGRQAAPPRRAAPASSSTPSGPPKRVRFEDVIEGLMKDPENVALMNGEG